MIHLFFSQKNTTYEEMISQNGDVILKHVISAKAVFEKNSTWYVEIEFPKSDLLGMEITDESVIKVDLNFEKNQLYRIVYPKYKKSTDTYVVYATHVFFDSQKEVFVFDDRTVSGTWDDAIKTCNDIISNSSAKYPYQVLGHRWYDNPGYIEPEDGAIVNFINLSPTSGTYFALDSHTNSEAGQQIIAYETHLKRKAQTYMLKKLDDVNGYECFGILALGSMRWICRWGATDSSGTTVYTTDRALEPPAASYNNAQFYWTFYKNKDCSEELGANTYKICRPTNINFNIYLAESNQITNGSKAIIYRHGISNLAHCLTYRIVDIDSTQTAYWVRYNLIECIFGSEDNSMINRWPEADKHRYIAMFDNYNCYFGRSDYYIESLQPKDYFISNREIVEYTKKKSMENVVTGIIPKAYNGRILPNNEIVKSDKWDINEIHRIEVKEYSDIILQADKSDSSLYDIGTFIDEDTMQYYMRLQAKKTLEEELQEPQTETSVTFEDLFNSNVPNANKLKLNDIIYIETEDGNREKFLINKLTYNLVTELPEDIDLVLESED